jgi:hypothetical protein
MYDGACYIGLPVCEGQGNIVGVGGMGVGGVGVGVGVGTMSYCRW